MSLCAYKRFSVLTHVFNRGLFVFILLWPNVSCMTLEPQAEKDVNADKLLETNYNFAQKQIDTGQPEHALQTLRPLLTQFPDKPSLLNMVGLSYLALSNPLRAKIFFQKALNLEKNPTYALNLSSAHIALGSYRAAEKLLEPLLKDKTYPYKERLYHNYALTFEKRKNYKKAILLYNKAIDENPSYYLSHIQLGKIYQTTHQKQPAVLSYEKAVRSCPVCFDAVHELVLLLIENKEFSRASTLLSKFMTTKDTSERNKAQAKNLLSLTKRLSHEKL